MKILFFTGSRSEWGYIKPIIKLGYNGSMGHVTNGYNINLLDTDEKIDEK